MSILCSYKIGFNTKYEHAGAISRLKFRQISLLSALLVVTSFAFSPHGFSDTLEGGQIEDSQKTPNTCNSNCSSKSAPTSHWLDTSRDYVTTKSNNLAGWLDDFFGVQSSDLESASTSLRLQLRNRWEEHEGNDFKARLRGSIHLPQINKRLSLIFTDEVEEGAVESDPTKEIIDKSRDNTDVSVQYNVLENIRSRLDLHFGLRSSLKPKVSTRYRYSLPLSKDYFAEITETIYFKGGDGFGSVTRLKIDHPLANNRLLRWSNRLQYAEESNGVEWSTNLSLSQRLSKKRAIAYVVGTAGETRPNYLTTNYGVSVVFRQNILRPWLFMELEPAYKWKRHHIADSRDGVAQFTARLEVRFAEN